MGSLLIALVLSFPTPANADPGTADSLIAAQEATTASKPTIVLARQFVLVQWDWAEDPSISILIGHPQAATVTPLRLQGNIQPNGTWKFLVPDHVIATYQEVIIDPEHRSVVAVTIFEGARVTLGTSKASEGNTYGSMGDPFFIELDQGISCEGSGCAALRAGG
jgi:hypothetical protein